MIIQNLLLSCKNLYTILQKMTNSIGHIIGGKVVKEDGKSFEIFNPSNGKCIALGTNATKKNY